MRRALVVTDDCARHPFLASLPPHVRRGTRPVAIPGRPVRSVTLPQAPARPLLARPVFSRSASARLSTQDVKEFLIAYSACFIAISAFIS